ncbi:hypothetical protein KP509_39G024800 [Ceratopteris richardii]|uniref:Uncharacterized protein n=1 Tax=Ceratopteris richardii TaxID=49495 RepID=A0A8T2PZQ3_CERRI|nr:hypothetical protein KP509_39G024800 [Ceratopteris richardii]
MFLVWVLERVLSSLCLFLSFPYGCAYGVDLFSQIVEVLSVEGGSTSSVSLSYVAESDPSVLVALTVWIYVMMMTTILICGDFDFFLSPGYFHVACVCVRGW